MTKHLDYKTDEDFQVTYKREDFDKFMDKFFRETEFKNVNLLKQLAYYHYLERDLISPDTYALWRATRKVQPIY